MQSVQLTPGVWWVGARNPNLRVFDIIMKAPFGTTYNAYLVRGETGVALIDCVKAGFEQDLEGELRDVVSPPEITHIVLNHTEPDHSGTLRRMLELAPQAKVVTTRPASGFVRELLNSDYNAQIVKGGDTIDLGGKTLRFVDAPFLHWPETMMTYLVEDAILFSCDVFGCHYSGKGVFDDEADEHLADAQAYYYDVIFYPFKKYVQQALARVNELPLRMIAPSHGPVYRRDLTGIRELYARKAEATCPPGEGKKAVIAYVSSYGFTRTLAERMRAALSRAGLSVTLLNLEEVGAADAGMQIDQADVVAVGSPTFNRDVLPPVMGALSAVCAYYSQGKPATAFGSFGWSGEAVPMLEQRLASLGFQVIPGVKARLNPSDESLAAIDELAARLAQAAAARKGA